MVGSVWSINGEDKSGKSTFALSLPRPLRHFDLDVGGFNRAGWRYREEVASGRIVSKPYYLPQQTIRERLRIDGGKIQVRMKAPRRLTGIKELWYQILTDYIAVLEGDELAPTGERFASVVFDSGAQFWEIDTMAFLQEKQENQGPAEAPRQQLQPMEYKEPNARFRAVVYAGREVGINLAFTHNMTDRRENRPQPDGTVKEVVVGREPMGWKYMTKECDVELLCYTEQPKRSQPPTTHGRVTLCGLALDATGYELESPSWEKLDQLIRMMRGE